MSIRGAPDYRYLGIETPPFPSGVQKPAPVYKEQPDVHPLLRMAPGIEIGNPTAFSITERAESTEFGGYSVPAHKVFIEVGAARHDRLEHTCPITFAKDGERMATMSVTIGVNLGIQFAFGKIISESSLDKPAHCIFYGIADTRQRYQISLDREMNYHSREVEWALQFAHYGKGGRLYEQRSRILILSNGQALRMAKLLGVTGLWKQER